MIEITPRVSIGEDEVSFSAIRSQGAGGQNVNKVATAIQLRFDIKASSLSESVKQKLLALSDRRISREGVVVIKAQQFRTQEKNRLEAVERLCALIAAALVEQKRRVATRPTKGSQRRRMDSKSLRGKTKQLRGRVSDY
ncbi:alternative ribosome rescue aminoacyl-tRNA hydrolase ArfB [Neptunomonas marina]|uniref:Aminoacyl-tRNA hydrolase n=1 Tax=Neptunomonas marina TaxID=1815562 RepID=A0A437QEA2_9GAMM|nr:alternative ribosome rescue aminoacyl-tRNA hydrolase ArfB [Neptunomonas marina]RVU32759.1 aminoacyl-tRNA hydrolase [Neptunomonas marina]